MESRKESLQELVSNKIDRTILNAITESHLKSLEMELKNLSVTHPNRSKERAQEIETEIANSAVTTDSLVEFKEILLQIARRYGQNEQWAIGLLAHENAHANVAQQLDYKKALYMVIFTKDEMGRISSIQPSHVARIRDTWSTEEILLNEKAVTEAPVNYGEELSRGDIAQLKGINEDLDNLRRLNSW